MRVTVNQATCEGTGFCERLAPSVFQVNDEGASEALVDVVPPEDEDAAREAEGMCPTRSIDVLE